MRRAKHQDRVLFLRVRRRSRGQCRGRLLRLAGRDGGEIEPERVRVRGGHGGCVVVVACSRDCTSLCVVVNSLLFSFLPVSVGFRDGVRLDGGGIDDGKPPGLRLRRRAGDGGIQRGSEARPG